MPNSIANFTDLYPGAKRAAAQPETTPAATSGGRKVETTGQPTVYWLALVALIILARIAYEKAG